MRTVDEWIGKTDDEAIPDRVRLRVFFRDKGRCKACNRMMRPGDAPQYDHIVALVNGGQNRETNIQLLCDWCHKDKTKTDVGAKSDANRVRAKHFGLRKPKGRPMPGSKASGLRKRMDGTVEKRK